MKFTLDKQEKYVLLQLHETKLDATLTPLLKTEMVTLHAEGFKNLILDLSETKYMDSSGLSAVLTGNRLCKEAEGIFVLTGLSDHVMKLIKISQLESVLQILPTVPEAVDAVFFNELESEFGKEEKD